MQVTDSMPAHEMATLAPTPPLALRFTGSGSEYFRIWIVNLLLTVVTFGIYFPYAKARKLRYFHENTLIGDAQDNRLQGLDGNDSFIGGTGHDTWSEDSDKSSEFAVVFVCFCEILLALFSGCVRVVVSDEVVQPRVQICH